MTSIRDALRDGAAVLVDAGVDNPRLDARLLLGHVLGGDVWPHQESVVSDHALREFRGLVDRRRRREPVSRIIGRRGFWTLDLAVTPATLDPRPESETLIEAALSVFGNRPAPARILDLGTGTGCLLLAALQEFAGATGVGVDRSPEAAAVAQANAEALGLGDRARFAATDWSDFEDLAAESGPGDARLRFDLVLSNPPYIAVGEIDGLDPEVRDFDPRPALVAGSDGLEAYRQLAEVIPRHLSRDGVAILELGAGQAYAVAKILDTAGLRTVECRRDLAGIERALVLEWNDTRSASP